MKHLSSVAAVMAATLALAPTLPAQTLGSPPPALEAVQWYNSPPLTLEDLKGRTVLVEVFRTW